MQAAHCGHDQVNVTWDTETEVHVLRLFLGVYFFQRDEIWSVSLTMGFRVHPDTH